MSPNYFHMSESETNPVSWLWPARIPSGKLTLLIGHPGVGKSLLATELIRRSNHHAVIVNGICTNGVAAGE